MRHHGGGNLGIFVVSGGQIGSALAFYTQQHKMLWGVIFVTQTSPGSAGQHLYMGF